MDDEHISGPCVVIGFADIDPAKQSVIAWGLNPILRWGHAHGDEETADGINAE